jgi:hypothetical protein
VLGGLLTSIIDAETLDDLTGVLRRVDLG